MRKAFFGSAVLALALGCSDDSGDTGSVELPEGCDAMAEPSQDDQTTVGTLLNEAEDGQTLCLSAGTYSFTRELSLVAGNVTLRGDGMDETILDFSAQLSGANGLKLRGDGTTIEQLQVRNTPGDGIRADDIVDITFDTVKVAWEALHSVENGAYGVYPVQSTGVIVRNSVIDGARDAGVYVGQSTDVLVEDNEALNNVAGIEVENTTNAIVRNNHAHDNTGGILVFNLPGLDVKDGRRANIYNNIIENNNAPNFAEEGTIVQMVPSGSGIVVLAADENEFWGNTITGHRSVGIVIIAYLEFLFGPTDDPEFDLYAETNHVHDNTWSNNGFDPDDLVGALTGTRPVPDIVFDGCSDADKDNASGMFTNCVSSESGTFLSAGLCPMGMETTDLGDNACSHPALPTE